MIKLKTTNKSVFNVKLFFKGEKTELPIIEKEYAITEDISTNTIFIYLSKKDMSIDDVKKVAKKLAKYPREVNININDFVMNDISENQVIDIFVRNHMYANHNNYLNKRKKPDENFGIVLSGTSANGARFLSECMIVGEAVNYTRKYQSTPPNILNSETFAKMLKEDFKEFPNVSVKILNKTEITKHGMGLLLSVNKGSAYEPRVAIFEYVGDKNSKSKTVVVGKGITFDSGGMNVKTGNSMNGMKFDMSGAAIAVGAITAIAQIKPTTNFTAVLVLTDNMISPVASTPDSVWTAMNGKTVEINNTDAEGRLALADGLTYGAKVLGATRLVDVATLTGAMRYALGETYVGVWATTDNAWNDLSKAARSADEKVWRMPLDEEFSKNIKSSKVADLFNSDPTVNAGASTATMFLKEFTEGVEYIHLDVAATADIKDEPTAVMLRTLVELAKQK